MSVLKVDTERVRGPLLRALFGQLVEHYGSVVYGGLADPRSGEPFPSVVESLRAMGVPVLRWPGGNFASGYHWEDGIGPRERRPVRYDLEWQVEEPNTFGTEEYLACCRTLGAEPYICANAGSGTAEEAARWVEYCNREGSSACAARRVAHGSPRPHGVRLWGIGNEVYGRGQIGRQDVDEYIGTVREYARLMKKVDPLVRFVAVGWERAEWNFRLVKEAGEYFDYLALHSYHAVPAAYREAMAFPLVVAEQIREMLGAIDSASYYVKDRRGAPIRIAMDEWNLQEWDHERFIEWQSLAFGFLPTNPELTSRRSSLATESRPLDPARMASFLRERRAHDDEDASVTLTDALYAASILHEMMRAGGRIALGGYSPMVNGKGLIGVRDGQVVRRPTYHVFQLLGSLVGAGSTVLDSYLRCDGYEQFVRSDAQNVRRTFSVPMLDAVCVLDEPARRLSVSVVNRNERETETCAIHIEGCRPRRVRRTLLQADAVDAANTPSHPERVVPVRTEEDLGGSLREEAFLPHSYTLLSYDL